MSNFPEKLRQAMHEKRCKSADVAKGTGINPSVLSRYLSGANKPRSDNIIAISHYLNVSPEWLLSSSGAPESIQKSKVISSVTEPLLKTIEVQDKLIKNLEKRVNELEKKPDKNTSPDDTLKQLFDLIDQFGSYMAFAIGRAGGLDEDNESHKWLQSEMDRLDSEIEAIRASFFSEPEIRQAQMENLQKVKHLPPQRSKGGRPRKK